jgi:Peptidase propeptide and YPEB domain
MKSQHKRVVLAASAAMVLGLISVAAAWSLDTSDPRRMPAVSEGDAVAAVRAFATSARDAKAEGTIDGALGRAYQVSGSDVRALVDVADGRVVLYQRPSAVATVEADGPRPAFVSAADALAAAVTFLDAHKVSVSGLGAPDVELLDHGASVEYVITWQKMNADGVLLPDSRTVRVNPISREVFSYLDLQRPFVAPGIARVSSDEAVRVAQQSSGDGEVEASRLAVSFNAAGQQMLVWRITLDRTTVEGAHVAWVVIVDANSGQVVAPDGAP